MFSVLTHLNVTNVAGSAAEIVFTHQLLFHSIPVVSLNSSVCFLKENSNVINIFEDEMQIKYMLAEHFFNVIFILIWLFSYVSSIFAFTVIDCWVSRQFPYKAQGPSESVYLTSWKWIERLLGETSICVEEWGGIWEHFKLFSALENEQASSDLWWLPWESQRRKNGVGNHQSFGENMKSP